MFVEGELLASQTGLFEFSAYVRVIPCINQATPLGCKPGNSRFGGTGKSFAVVYAAKNLATALAETIVRDRFEGLLDRRLFAAELADRMAVQIDAIRPLRLVDLREGGCLKLGISTEIAGAKCFNEAQQFSDFLYKNTTIDGIIYASRLTTHNCVALFDRAIAEHLTSSSIVPLIQLDEVRHALQELNIQLLE